ncbi:hypothetical protein CQ054_22925 [Ochrobactrum sp. MYb29]|nr:hypothetical protein CQ054_22925 [Ochrobactrum sp. MYb29]
MQQSCDPLVLDLDGDGIELVSADKSGVHFDFESDGFAEKTGWLRPDEAFLTTVQLIGEIQRRYLRKFLSSILVSFIMETLAQDKFAKLCSIVTRKIDAVCTAPAAKKAYKTKRNLFWSSPLDP